MRKFVKYKHAHASIGGKKLHLLVADSFPKHMLGLMYMRSIKESEGMLFIFSRNAYHGIWMRNMLFPIDIIWLDEKFEVVDIVENAEPCQSIFGCKTYMPISQARYVIELNAGSSKKLGIKKGSRLIVEIAPGEN
ncbi:MAG: DUF192 domain-containing protein [Candidatus Micrarchaeia archaeon]